MLYQIQLADNDFIDLFQENKWPVIIMWAAIFISLISHRIMSETHSGIVKWLKCIHHVAIC